MSSAAAPARSPLPTRPLPAANTPLPNRRGGGGRPSATGGDADQGFEAPAPDRGLQIRQAIRASARPRSGAVLPQRSLALRPAIEGLGRLLRRRTPHGARPAGRRRRDAGRWNCSVGSASRDGSASALRPPRADARVPSLFRFADERLLGHLTGAGMGLCLAAMIILRARDELRRDARRWR